MRWGKVGCGAIRLGIGVGTSFSLGYFTLGSDAGVGRVGRCTRGGGGLSATDGCTLGECAMDGGGIRWRRVLGGGIACARCCLLEKRMARADGRGSTGDADVAGKGDVTGATGDSGVGEVVTLKMAASCFIAAICSVPKAGNGDAGDGLSSAAVSSRAASVAASAEEVVGMGVLWGKKSTEREILSARVLGM